ncbi:MAG: hypothetical protein JNL52_13820 [Flavobacteriales bacterium]|nr:hypothetical protein [Flavobacteriales bacterium]
MRSILSTTVLLAVIGLLATGCGSLQQTTAVRDDVYFSPGSEPMAAATPIQAEEPAVAEATDDYYSAQEAPAVGSSGFYDIAYNDPYYYNYDRFGFGQSPFMQGGMYMGGFGVPGGYGGWNSRYIGFGMSFGMGWPYQNGMTGPLAWYAPWSWYDPMTSNPWGWSSGMGWGYGLGHGMGWGYGMGYGPYYGPWGACMTCYCPVVVGGGGNVVYGPRPGTGGAGRTVPNASGMRTRDPISLTRTMPRTSKASEGARPTLSEGRQLSGTRPATGVNERSTSPQARPAQNDRARTPSTTYGRPATSPGRSGGAERGTEMRSSPGGGGGVGRPSVPGRPR